MPIKKTIQLGNPILRQKAAAVADLTVRPVQRIIADLIDTMRAENLVGLAAPQIGASLRIFVTEIRRTKYRKNVDDLDHLHVYVNPQITSVSKKTAVDYEGCGSVGEAAVFGQVRRPDSIRVRASNEEGEQFEREASGLLARVIQHEMDHLNGIAFTDKLVSFKTLISRSEYLKIANKKAKNKKKQHAG